MPSVTSTLIRHAWPAEWVPCEDDDDDDDDDDRACVMRPARLPRCREWQTHRRTRRQTEHLPTVSVWHLHTIVSGFRPKIAIQTETGVETGIRSCALATANYCDSLQRRGVKVDIDNLRVCSVKRSRSEMCAGLCQHWKVSESSTFFRSFQDKLLVTNGLFNTKEKRKIKYSNKIWNTETNCTGIRIKKTNVRPSLKLSQVGVAFQNKNRTTLSVFTFSCIL